MKKLILHKLQLTQQLTHIERFYIETYDCPRKNLLSHLQQSQLTTRRKFRLAKLVYLNFPANPK